MMETAFTDMFGLRYPIMQTPMGSVSTPELVAAVSNAGGMGMLACAGLPPDEVRRQIRHVRRLTAKSFGVNLLLPLLQDGQLEVCIVERVPLLSLFWGDPSAYVDAAHAAGIRVVLQIGSVAEAQAAHAAGVDLLIAQGIEAGGHVRGTVATLALVPTVVDAVRSVPVLAAGGIADGRGLAAVLALGASGAALGTRFLASEESGAHPEYKGRITQATADDTYHTTLFDIGWPDAPHRVLRNHVINEWENAGRPASGERPGEGQIIGAAHYAGLELPVPRYSVFPPIAGFHGDVEKAAMYAGQSCGAISNIRPAAELVTDIACEAEAVLDRLRRSRQPRD